MHEPIRTTSWVSVGLLRVEGLQEFLELERMPLEHPASLGELLAERLDAPGAPTAIVASHDELAAVIHRALVGVGIVPGRDVALCGDDDGPLAAALDLTTVRQPFEESGRTAMELLLARIAEGPSAISRVTLGIELVARATSCPPRDAQPRRRRTTTSGPA